VFKRAAMGTNPCKLTWEAPGFYALVAKPNYRFNPRGQT
jgi:hypothetical protein